MVSNFGFFVTRRAINALITVVLLLALVFALLHILIPSPEAMARIIVGNPRASPGITASIIKANNLDAPLYVQFFNYLWNTIHGNFGVDTQLHIPEVDVLKEYLPITLELVVVGQIIGVLIGLYTGAIAAANRNRAPDYGMKALYLTTWSAPIFLVAFIFQLILAYWLNLLPASGVVDPILYAPHYVTGMPLVDALIAGDWVYFWSALQHLLLPAFTIAVIGFGLVTRIERSSMIDALDRDYVKLAYMKGLSKRKVVWGTAFRNALIPIITLVALLFATSVGGSVIVEVVYHYHGMGFFTVNAAFNYDYTAILAFTIIIGISVIAANFVADLLYAIADPRVRLT
ncbi:MAG: ABC transporter permease [Thaumarchaeota archaeon]|nr:ABC transporter permease [Nitrososphaerota archaeon]